MSLYLEKTHISQLICEVQNLRDQLNDILCEELTDILCDSQKLTHILKKIKDIFYVYAKKSKTLRIFLTTRGFMAEGEEFRTQYLRDSEAFDEFKKTLNILQKSTYSSIDSPTEARLTDKLATRLDSQT